MSGTIRTNKNPGVIIQEQHNDAARVSRYAEHGFVPGTLVNDISVRVLIGANRHVHITNRHAAVVQYVAFGDVTVTVADGTDGVPIFPQQTLRLCSGTTEYIIGTTNDLHVVLIED